MEDPAFTWAVVVGAALIGVWRWARQSGVRAERERVRAALSVLPPTLPRPPAPESAPEPDPDVLTPAGQAVLDDLTSMGFPEDVTRRAIRRNRGADVKTIKESVIHELVGG